MPENITGQALQIGSESLPKRIEINFQPQEWTELYPTSTTRKIFRLEITDPYIKSFISNDSLTNIDIWVDSNSKILTSEMGITSLQVVHTPSGKLFVVATGGMPTKSFSAILEFTKFSHVDFMLGENLNIGDTIEVAVKPEYQHYLGKSIVWKVADKNHAGYPTNSVTLITDKIIAILPFDAKEPTNPNTSRKNYGNNHYSVSNIRQWLNSNAKAGKWYSAQHEYDAPPNANNVHNGYNPYDTWPGFLEMLDPNFVGKLKSTTLTVAKPVADGGGSETVIDKMFLASATEIGLVGDKVVVEGSKLAIFTEGPTETLNESRKTTPTQAALDNNEKPDDGYDNLVHYTYRTPYTDNSSSYVRENGRYGAGFYSYYAYSTSGIRPLCNVSFTFFAVTKTKNANGHYEYTPLIRNETSMYGRITTIPKLYHEEPTAAAALKWTVSETQPSNPAAGDLWIKGNPANIKIDKVRHLQTSKNTIDEPAPNTIYVLVPAKDYPLQEEPVSIRYFENDKYRLKVQTPFMLVTGNNGETLDIVRGVYTGTEWKMFGEIPPQPPAWVYSGITFKQSGTFTPESGGAWYRIHCFGKCGDGGTPSQLSDNWSRLYEKGQAAGNTGGYSCSILFLKDPVPITVNESVSSFGSYLSATAGGTPTARSGTQSTVVGTASGGNVHNLTGAKGNLGTNGTLSGNTATGGTGGKGVPFTNPLNISNIKTINNYSAGTGARSIMYGNNDSFSKTPGTAAQTYPFQGAHVWCGGNGGGGSASAQDGVIFGGENGKVVGGAPSKGEDGKIIIEKGGIPDTYNSGGGYTPPTYDKDK